MNWIRTLAVVGLILSAGSCAHSCGETRKYQAEQDRARVVASGYTNIDPESEKTVTIVEKDLAALIFAWGLNYGRMPELTLLSALASMATLILFTVILMLGGRKKASNQVPQVTARQLAEPEH